MSGNIEERSFTVAFAEAEALFARLARNEAGSAKAWAIVGSDKLSTELGQRARAMEAAGRLAAFCRNLDDYRLRMAARQIMLSIFDAEA